MNQSTEFRGVCPICYIPVKEHEEYREIRNEDKAEVYHAVCLREWMIQNNPNIQHVAPEALVQHKQLIHSIWKKEQYVASNSQVWEATGEILRDMRETTNMSLKDFASRLGISIGRLKRFESGEPVRDAKLLFSAYLSLITFYRLNLEFAVYRQEHPAVDVENSSQCWD